MKTTKKPMMAKRTTKAAPAKKKMMTSAKKPMTVAGKKVRKYQVGGPAMNAPKGTVTAPGFPSMPTMPPNQGMVANNRGAMMGQSPNYAQANELLSRMDPRSPFYGAIQQRLQQTGGLQANNGGPMIANNPGGMGMLSPEQIARNNMARQQLMQQGMTPGQIQAQEAAIRQEMLRRGMPLGQGMGLPIGPRQTPNTGKVGGITRTPEEQMAFQQALAKRPSPPPPPSKPYNPALDGPRPTPSRPTGPGTPLPIARRAAGFSEGGAVKRKKAPANGRMAKPKGRMSTRGKR